MAAEGQHRLARLFDGHDGPVGGVETVVINVQSEGQLSPQLVYLHWFVCVELALLMLISGYSEVSAVYCASSWSTDQINEPPTMVLR